MDNNINIHIAIPKAIGESQSLVIATRTPLLEALLKLNQNTLMDKIMKNEHEFNQFVLVYLDNERVKDPFTLLMKNDCIEIIIPMAGG